MYSKIKGIRLKLSDGRPAFWKAAGYAWTENDQRVWGGAFVVATAQL